MKKLLVISAVAALGLTSVASAGGLPEEMPMAPVAMSSDAGVYLGLSGGWGFTNWKNFTDINTTINGTSDSNGPVGRAFLGYDFNKYFAVEAGYSYFFTQEKLQAGAATYHKVKTQVVDLFGKISAPLVDEVSLYAKLGANYLMSNVEQEESAGAGSFNNSRNAFNVAYGAGIDYIITPNIIVNAEWLRHNGSPKANSAGDRLNFQPNTDSFLVGLRYKFDL